MNAAERSTKCSQILDRDKDQHESRQNETRRQYYLSINAFVFCVLLQVMPGLLLCFVLRYDFYKQTQTVPSDASTMPATNSVKYYHKITYFHCSLVGYFLGKFYQLSLKKFFLHEYCLFYFFIFLTLFTAFKRICTNGLCIGNYYR